MQWQPVQNELVCNLDILLTDRLNSEFHDK